MRRITKTVSLIFLGFLILAIGCRKEQDLEQEKEKIKSLLISSPYTNVYHLKAGEGKDTLLPGRLSTRPEYGITVLETIPFVKFGRKISQVTKTITVQIPAYPGYPETTALATITANLIGTFYVIYDTTTNPIKTWKKAIDDSAHRQVYLTKGNQGWKIRRLTPIEFFTNNAPYEIQITKIRAEARPSNSLFEITTADTFLTKSDLPTFWPQDTVKGTVTIQVTGDSAWAFLHRGKPAKHRRHRDPFYRVSTFQFEREWIISTDGEYDRPEVRASAVDIIGWQTLWQDTTGHYNCRAWGLPYVVKNSQDTYPE